MQFVAYNAFAAVPTVTFTPRPLPPPASVTGVASFPCTAPAPALPPTAATAFFASTIVNTHGISLAFTYNNPVCGSYDDPANTAPPSNPGKITVPCLEGAIKSRPVR